MEELLKELQGETGFERCKSYVDYITSVNDDSLGFVYDRGWNMLTGVSANSDDLFNAIKLVLVMITAFSFLLFEDYKYKINGILDVTANKRRLVGIKFAYAMVILVITYAVIYLPQIIWVNKNMGLDGFNYSVKSLMYKSDVGISVSILGYMIITALVRMTGLIILLGVLYLIGRLLKSTGAIVVTGMLVIALPMLLAYIGVSGFDGYVVTKILAAGWW